MKTIHGMEELAAAQGEEIGVTEWQELTQDQIDVFSDATGDHYWIHVDPERAKEGPLGSTVAHGLYTLSLGPAANYALIAFEGFGVQMNYGYEKVRFPAPVPVGSRLRMRLQIGKVQASGVGTRVVLRQTFECEGSDKPACIAEMLLYLAVEPSASR